LRRCRFPLKVILGGQTLQLPEIDIDSIAVSMNLDLTISLFDIATSFGLVYNGAPVTIRDDVAVTLAVTQVRALVAAFLAIDWSAVERLPFVSMYKHPLDCALSSFYAPPGVPGSIFDAVYPSVPAKFSGASDAATLMLVSAVEATMFVYQRAFPPIVSNTLNSSLTTLFDPSICLGPNVDELDSQVPFDFEDSLFSLILEMDDRTLFDALLGVLFDEDEAGDRMSLNILSDDHHQSVNYTVELPNLDGVDHSVTLTVNRMAVELDTNLVVRNLNLLEIGEASDGTRRQLTSSASLDHMSLVLDLDITEFFETVATRSTRETSSNLVVSFGISDLDFSLGLFLNVLKYDMESVALSQIFNLDCWLATMDSAGGGGITDIGLVLGAMNVSATCDACESSTFVDVAELLNGPEAQTIFADLANGLTSGLSASIVDSFSGSNLKELVGTAKEQCAAGTGGLRLNSFLGVETRTRLLESASSSVLDAILDVLAGAPGAILNPFVRSGDSNETVPAALEAEGMLDTNGDELLSLTDGDLGAILLNTVFNTDYPTTGDDASDEFIRTVLSIVRGIDLGDDGTSILELLFELLDIESQLLSDDTHAINLDVLELLGSLGMESSASGLQLFSFDITNQCRMEIAARNANLATEVTISTTEGLEFLGEQTVLLPPASFGHLSLGAVLSVRLVVDDINGLVGLGGPDPVRFEVEENVSIFMSVQQLRAKMAALLAVNLDALKTLELGPAIETPMDCVLAVFAAMPSLTGVFVEAEGVQLTTGGGVLGRFSNIIIDAYEVKLPDVLSFALNSILGDSTDMPLLADTGSGCLPVEVALREVPFNFETGLFAELKGFLGRTQLESILASLLSDMDGEDGMAAINIIKPEKPVEISFSLPQAPGVSTPPFAAFFGINKIALGLTKPFQIGNFSLLEVDDTERWAEYFPQGLLNTLSVTSAFLDLEVVLVLGPNQTDVNETSVAASRMPLATNPIQHDLLGKVELNTLTARLYFEELTVAAMAWAKISSYAVYSMPLQSITSPNCWLSLLEKPGGIKSLNATVNSVSADVQCDCETPYVQSLADAFSNGREGLEGLVNGAAKVWTTEIEQEFEGVQWGMFHTAAVQGCSNDTVLKFGVALSDFEATDFDAESTSQAIAFTSVFAGLSGTIFFFSKRHATHFKTKSKNIAKSVFAKASSSSSSIRNKKSEAALREVESGPSMFFNEKLPYWMRLSMLFAIFVNLGMFIYGDTQSSFIIGAEASLLGEPIDFGNIQEFSVISSTIKLFESGAIYLAVMLFFLAIFWPYAKLTTMLVCLLVPPKYLRAQWRGKIIHALDIFGKYSFVEVYFVSFILTILRLSVQSPNLGFLPDELAEDLFSFDLLVLPQPSLYVFLAALVQSLLLSNVMLRFHTLIEEGVDIEMTMTSDDLECLEAGSARAPPSPKAWSVLGRVLPGHTPAPGNANNQPVRSMYSWVTEEEGTQAQLSVLCSCVFSLLAAIFVVAAWSVPVMTVDMHGFAKLLFELEGASVSNDIGLAELVSGLLESGSFGETFIALFIVFTLCVMPLLSIASHLVTVFAPMTRETAIYNNDVRAIIQSWSAVEIFIIAVLFTAFELGHLTESLVTDEQCELVGNALVGALLPLGLLSEEDAAVGCFKASTTLQIGVYFALVAIMLLGARSALVKPFSMVADPEGDEAAPERQKMDKNAANMFVNPVFLIVNKELNKQRRATSYLPRQGHAGPLVGNHPVSPPEGCRFASSSLNMPTTSPAC
jgi:hypothetical protein